ncbi:unnamed protein product, partial [Mesorhabditis belari]|uniref:POU domain protein n=1 Tax=Mesorhabditis belari TaxID=2138241 RepID=A0AAF3E9E5_9BILA
MQPQRFYPLSLNPIPSFTSASSSVTNVDSRRMQTFQSQSIFGFDNSIFNTGAAQALADIDVKNVNTMLRPDMFSNYLMGHGDGAYGLPSASGEGFEAAALLPVSSHEPPDGMVNLQQVMAMHHSYPAPFPQYPMPTPFPTSVVNPTPTLPRYPLAAPNSGLEVETDPRELERFAEHFKQRRIKLGVTQADVGKALAHLKMPGVGSLSQSTICRFESLTLSHNNMVALKPILHSWLEKAEEAMKGKDGTGELSGILPNTDKKRKRTSIAAPEKRLLEDFFRQQPRPSGERIAAIADKLDLKKNVVRVWFCNQRQKQKRDFRSQFRCRGGVAGGLPSTLSARPLLPPTSTTSLLPTKCSPFTGYFESTFRE